LKINSERCDDTFSKHTIDSCFTWRFYFLTSRNKDCLTKNAILCQKVCVLHDFGGYYGFFWPFFFFSKLLTRRVQQKYTQPSTGVLQIETFCSATAVKILLKKERKKKEKRKLRKIRHSRGENLLTNENQQYTSSCKAHIHRPFSRLAKFL